jgi:hypothetical protein
MEPAAESLPEVTAGDDVLRAPAPVAPIRPETTKGAAR